MKFKTLKFILIAFLGLSILFFSNNFGLVDIERTTIITAIAIDVEENGDYNLTAQIAVPEATDTNTENNRTQISARGGTAGAALKNLANISGWYPNLSYCNLIILGHSFANIDVMEVLDYFLTTFRLQDSALVVMAEKSASEILAVSTPLDDISSFAIQKIIIKNKNFENNVIVSDIKDFSQGYYSNNHASYMPILSLVKENIANGQSSSSGSNNSKEELGVSSGSGASGSVNGGDGKEEQDLFYADKTALFIKGKMVGVLTSEQSFMFNNFIKNMNGATFELKGISDGGGQKRNVLLTVFRNDAKIKVKADENNLIVDFKLNLLCKISDQNYDSSQNNLSSNAPLPNFVIDYASKYLKQTLEDLVEASVQTGCDFLNIQQVLYQKSHKQYSRYKDNLLTVMKKNITVNFSGPK